MGAISIKQEQDFAAISVSFKAPQHNPRRYSQSSLCSQVSSSIYSDHLLRIRGLPALGSTAGEHARRRRSSRVGRGRGLLLRLALLALVL